MVARRAMLPQESGYLAEICPHSATCSGDEESRTMRGMWIAVRRAIAVLSLLSGFVVSVPAAVATASPPSASAPGRLADDPIAHDPTIIKQGRYYYAFITG